MESALIALISVLVGILCNEHFRRKNRIEYYSQKIFDNRLIVHEKLFHLLQQSYEIASELMSGETYSEEERKEIIGPVIHSICEFTDLNEFYLDKYLTVHVCTAFMGAEDIMGYADEAERESARMKVRSAYKTAKDMIISESGAAEVFKHFKSISKSKPDSAVIRYIKELEKNKA